MEGRAEVGAGEVLDRSHSFGAFVCCFGDVVARDPAQPVLRIEKSEQRLGRGGQVVRVGVPIGAANCEVRGGVLVAGDDEGCRRTSERAPPRTDESAPFLMR